MFSCWDFRNVGMNDVQKTKHDNKKAAKSTLEMTVVELGCFFLHVLKHNSIDNKKNDCRSPLNARYPESFTSNVFTQAKDSLKVPWQLVFIWM